MSPKKRPQPEQRVLTDPRAIRALAHPARLAVLERLSDGSELTATDCAEATGLSASAMSYHLRALEKWGFVERAPSSEDGRERPWRALATRWRIDEMGNRATAAAADTMLGTILDQMRAYLAEWYARERDQPKAWKDVATVSTSTVWMTAEEAAEVLARHTERIDRLRGRSAADHPPGARRVRVGHLVIPIDYQ